MMGGSVARKVRNRGERKPQHRKSTRSATEIHSSAVPAKLPGFVDPELTTLLDAVPEGQEWLYEIKFDGYRALCRIEGGQARFFTREGNDWTKRFGVLATAAARLPVSAVFLDGEIVVLESDGSSNFQSLQEALGRSETDRLIYYVFDLPFFDGHDLRAVPLEARKQLLAGLLEQQPKTTAVRFSDHVTGNGKEFYRRACAGGLEGIIAKRKNAPYRAGRARDWFKIKCHSSQEFVIGGFTEPSGSRTGLGALLLGVNNDRSVLIYAGKVGTGFNRRSLEDLRARLEKIETPSPPFANPPRLPRREGVHWVQPRYAAEIEFTGWTRDGMLRHPSFKGLREDKSARKISRERPEPNSATARQNSLTTIAGVTLSNPERVLYPEANITKLELARYYEEIADWILPHVALRPLTMVRCPEGYRKCFYQKHIEENLPESFKRINVKERKASGRYVMIDSLPGLISLVQMGVLEIHTWGSRAEHVEMPDQLIFDLDPDSGLAWRRVVEAARLLRRRVAELGLEAFVKTTGGKGLHIVVPVAPEVDWEEAKEFTKNVAESIARNAPDRYLTNMSKTKRAGKIFIDYLRNGRGATAVAAYSTRARAGAPVSVPLRWEELDDDIRGDHFTLRNVRQRLTRLRKDPWANFSNSRRSILAAIRQVAAPRQ
jgi:bifunctional non-homologous end joining protein LigD